MEGLIGSIIVGILAGFIASKLMGGEGKGCLMNCVLGLFGGLVGGYIFKLLGIEWGNGWIGQTGTAIVGAVIVLWIASKIRK